MERLLFKFYKSYFLVASELNDKDRLLFYDALMNKQFNGIEPILSGMSKFAYISQKHSIDSQVKGWEDKTGMILNNPTIPPTLPPTTEEEEKVKEEVKDKEKTFDEFRIKYLGTKRGNKTEFENFIKKHKDWKEVLPTLKTCLETQIEQRKKLKESGKFVPEWKNLQTWINQRCWEEILTTEETKQKTEKYKPLQW